MEIITFESAKIVNSETYGLSVEFKLTFFQKQNVFLKNKEYWLRITITHFALLGWGFKEDLNENQVIKIAFPFAVELISEKVKDGTLKEFEEKIISREDNYFPYPFDLKKVDKIEGYEIIFLEDNIDIGKRIQTNLIADTIIELRDNINALIYSKNKDILLRLGQERNILNLFRSIDNREQFSYAVLTLGNLVTDLNVDLLRKITGNTDEDIKSLSLLEEFLSKIDPIPNNCIEIFRTLNRIRMGFPIHTDKTEIIRSLGKFNIDYPIEDHNKVWQIMIEKYKDGLSELLVKIKKYAE